MKPAMVTQLEKSNARASVKYCLKVGKLLRLSCEYADCTEAKTEAHHPDYNYPLDVLWLCRHHHLELHRYMKVIEVRI